jgi:hypothetical protein
MPSPSTKILPHETPASPDPREIIGYQEYVSFPEWGIDRLLAKSDTGARSSALDAKNIEELPNDRVRFDVALSRKNRDRTVAVEADIVRRTRVRSSHGHTTERLVVATPIRIGWVETVVELTLVNRKRMICRMLLGRTALSESFLVDAGQRFLVSEQRVRKKKKAI